MASCSTARRYSAGILKRIVACLFDPYLFKMSVAEAALQQIEDNNCKVFSRRNNVAEFRRSIQILVVETLENLRLHMSVKIDKIAYHAGRRIDFSADRDLDRVIVAVPMWVIALPVDRSILLFAERIVVEAMRRGDPVPACEVGLHQSP